MFNAVSCMFEELIEMYRDIAKEEEKKQQDAAFKAADGEKDPEKGYGIKGSAGTSECFAPDKEIAG